MRRVQVVTAACAALMWTTAAGVPMVAAQGAGSGGAQSSQAGSSSGPTAGTSAIGDQSGATEQAGTATTTGTQGSGDNNELQQFVEKAAVANMAEIQLGQLAQKQAQDPQVKQFAQMMVDEHTGALEQLRTAASSQGLQVASALDNKHQKLNDKLAKLQGSEFDRAYMDAMVDTHKDAEKLLKKRAGKSASGSEMTSDRSTAGAAGTSSGDQSGASATGTTGTTGTSGSSTSGTAGTSGSTSGSTETSTPSVGTPGTTAGSTGTSGASSSGISGSSATGSAGSMSAPKTADEWAAMTLPKVRAHLEQARSLEDQVKESARSNNTGGDNSGGAENTGSGSGAGSTGSGSTPPTPPRQ